MQGKKSNEYKIMKMDMYDSVPGKLFLAKVRMSLSEWQE